MTNWLVSLIKKSEPFDKKDILVTAETIQECFDKVEIEHPRFHARCAQFHSVNMDNFSINQSAVEEAIGWGWGPTS